MESAKPVGVRGRSRVEEAEARWRGSARRGAAISVLVHVAIAAAVIGADRPAPDDEAPRPAAPVELVSWLALPVAEVAEAPAERAVDDRSDEPAPAAPGEEQAVADAPSVDGVEPYPPALAGAEASAPPPPAEVAPARLRLVSHEVPRPGAASAGRGWPLIRNPEEIQRFLRQWHAALHGPSAAGAYVQIALSIDARGRVRTSTIRRSSGDPELDALALALLCDVAKYDPPRERGVAGPVTVLVTVPFDPPA